MEGEAVANVKQKNEKAVKTGKALVAAQKGKQRQLLELLEKNKPALETSEIGAAGVNPQVKNETHMVKYSADISGKRVRSNDPTQEMNFLQESGYIMLAVGAVALIYLIITKKKLTKKCA